MFCSLDFIADSELNLIVCHKTLAARARLVFTRNRASLNQEPLVLARGMTSLESLRGTDEVRPVNQVLRL